MFVNSSLFRVTLVEKTLFLPAVDRNLSPSTAKYGVKSAHMLLSLRN